MTRNLLFSAVPVCMAFQLAALPSRALGQEVFGGVDGVTRDSASKQPVAQVRITAHNVTKGTDCTAISGSDGAFRIAELEPGLYQVAAVRDGFIRSTANVEVAAPGTYRVDFLLAADYPPAPVAKASAPAAMRAASAMAEELAALKERIEQLEAALRLARRRWKPPRRRAGGPGAAAPAAAAGAPAPAPQAPAPAAPAPAPPAFRKPCRPPKPLPGWTTSLRSRTATLPGSTARRATRTPCWTRSSSPRKSDSTRTLWKIQSAEGPHDGRGDRVVPVRRIPGGADQRRRRLPLAKRPRQDPDHVRTCSPPRRRATTPAPEWANGTSATLTDMSRRPTAAITST